MNWKQQGRGAHTTTVCTFGIRCLPEICKEEFVNVLSEVLNSVIPHELNRQTNIISQQLLMDDASTDDQTCFWALHFNGTHAPEAVQSKCEEMYDGVRKEIEAVGTRVSVNVSTLQGEWVAIKNRAPHNL